jgi:hypothetical protein
VAAVTAFLIAFPELKPANARRVLLISIQEPFDDQIGVCYFLLLVAEQKG